MATSEDDSEWEGFNYGTRWGVGHQEHRAAREPSQRIIARPRPARSQQKRFISTKATRELASEDLFKLFMEKEDERKDIMMMPWWWYHPVKSRPMLASNERASSTLYTVLNVPSQTPALSFARLPPEIHKMVIDILDLETKVHLRNTNKYFRHLIKRPSHDEILEAELESNFDRYYACKYCVRLRPEHKFEIMNYQKFRAKIMPFPLPGQAKDAKLGPGFDRAKRCCIDCGISTGYNFSGQRFMVMREEKRKEELAFCKSCRKVDATTPQASKGRECQKCWTIRMGHWGQDAQRKFLEEQFRKTRFARKLLKTGPSLSEMVKEKGLPGGSFILGTSEQDHVEARPNDEGTIAIKEAKAKDRPDPMIAVRAAAEEIAKKWQRHRDKEAMEDSDED